MVRARRNSPTRALTGAPYLRQIRSLAERWKGEEFPFAVPAFRNGIDIPLETNVTFFVGENGSGKSTLLEAIAEICGFNPEGGSRDHHREAFADRSELAQALRLSWMPKMTDGFFMRAESFFNFATYLDGVSDFKAYGGKSLHAQSHGESFLALFDNRFEQGLYILDEPEAALSPQRQLAFLRIIHDLEAPGHAQFVIASHSPILLAYPGATLYQFTGSGIEEVAYRDTEHFLVTKDFLNAPERMLKYLFSEGDDDAT
ncbi:hemin importer ATP-binding subunit [Thiorhodovibrio litoralis]|nr:AAA family ATPase [Thiorhodovibrio winogradskyi]WPL12835.1 hemin importer ATP-binding subunit [Thiorhodovibrio litoralis]